MRIMISGTLHDSPKQRTSTNGNAFTVGKVRDDSTTPPLWASIMCFNELGELLAGMPKGAALSVSGKGTVDVYHPENGEPRPNISITVDQLITLKKPKGNA